MEHGKLPPPLDELVKIGTLRHIGDGDYAIDALHHRAMTALGWEDMFYTLRCRRLKGVEFEIMEENRDYGDDCMLATSDPEEVEVWILERVETDD